MRSYHGVKNKLAIEFSGWTGTSKAFLNAYRGDTPSYQHREYNALDIRNIRFDLIKVPHDTERPKKLPPVINFRMAKGGTGKTTICGNVASCMAMMGHRVLMIDGDPQSSLSGLFGVDWATQTVTHIGELMRRANSKFELTQIEDAIIPIYDNHMLDLIAADIEMAGADTWMTQMSIGREMVFTRLLEKEIDFFSQYDVIVVDSAPSTSLLTTSFMVASETVLAIVMPEGQSVGALKILQSNVQELNNHFTNRQYKIHIVVNRYNQGKKPHQVMLGQLIDTYGKFMNDTIVRDFVGFLRETIGVEECPHGTLIESEPNSVGARDIIDLAKSLIRLYNIKLIDGIVGVS